MSGIAETAAQAAQAREAGNTAFLAICEAEAKIIEAQGVVREIIGNGGSDTLSDWLMLLNQTHSQLIVARNTVPLANELGQRFINNLFS